jgi:ABC-type transport system involved in multi-copper enzyme maturation permease subunit
MSKAITEKQDEQRARAAAAGGGGPSLLVEGEPTVARVFGLAGGVCAIIGAVCLGMHLSGKQLALAPGWASLLLLVGLAGLLFHAAADKDVQFRLVYLVVAAVFLAGGVLLCLLPYPAHMGDLFFYGALALFTALLFAGAVLRNETDPTMRDAAQYGLLAVGGVMAAVGLVGGAVSKNFVGFGLMLALLGLLYLIAFVATRGLSHSIAYRTGQAVGALGAVTFLFALVRSLLPVLAEWAKWSWYTERSYFIPYGLLWMAVGLAYVAAYFLICSDRPLAALTRRELGAFFFSSMAYIVLFGFTFVCWISYLFFVNSLLGSEKPLLEPVIRGYLLALFPIITMIFVVPVLTMRLLSEEQRSGTVEVLLTAPVEEPAVVLSKFFAGVIIYLAVWVPFWLLLAALWVGGKPFDTYPLLAFFVGLLVTGMGFVSMGLFFSSLTRNQVASGVLTFAGMLGLTGVYILKGSIADDRLWKLDEDAKAVWTGILNQVSYLDYWIGAIEGKFLPLQMVFFASMTVFFLFVTVKVLESRKWR